MVIIFMPRGNVLSAKKDGEMDRQVDVAMHAEMNGHVKVCAILQYYELIFL